LDIRGERTPTVDTPRRFDAPAVVKRWAAGRLASAFEPELVQFFKGTALKKTFKLGARPSNLKQSFGWRCRLARSAYTLKVYATDIAGKHAEQGGEGPADGAVREPKMS
jgi:hypothetical protein